MRRIYSLMALVVFMTSAVLSRAQVNTGALPATISQNFNGLSSTGSVTWTNNTTPLVGWYSTVTTLAVNTGSTNANAVYNFGSASATDRALGAISTATTHRFGIRIANNSGAQIDTVIVSFTGEQWRSNTGAQSLTFDYQVGTTVTSLTAGTWTAVSGLDFLSPITAATPAALDGNVTANRTPKFAKIPVTIANGSEIFLRWTKAGSSSPALAVDDLSLTLKAAGPAGITSAQNGAWSSTATWVGGVVPTATDNVTIAHAVTSGAITRNSGTTTTINAGASLAMSGTYTNNGTTNVNGTFQLDGGGFASGNDLVYGAAGTLVFNITGAPYGVGASPAYWPTTAGPFNVTALGSGAQLQAAAGARTIAGTLSLSGQYDNLSTTTVTGTVQINGGGYVSGNSITYGSASNLVYNSTGTYGIGNEWTGNSTTAGLGVPNNVTVQNSTTITFPNTNRGCAGNFTITSGGATLNGTSGDLHVAGNFAQGGTFTPNGRAVVLNGAAAQSVTGSLSTAGATNNFSYLLINNSSGGVTLNTNTFVTASAGDVLQLLNAGALNIAAAVTLTLNNAGGNILASGGARTINFNAATSVVNITGSKTVTSTGGGTLSFTSTVAGGTLLLNTGLNCGVGLTTIANNAVLAIGAGGFVSTNSPTYATGSLLSFRSGASYNVGTTDRTWGPGTSGAGVPFAVEVINAGTIVEILDNRTITSAMSVLTSGVFNQNGNTLNIGATGGGNATLAVTSGTFNISAGTFNMNGSISVGATGTFNQTGGLIAIDPNSGTAGTSVASGTHFFATNATSVLNFSAGTIRFIDPCHSTYAANACRSMSINQSTFSNTIFTGTHTIELGDGVSTTAGNGDGFVLESFAGTARIPFNNVIVNGGATTGRWGAPSYTTSGGCFLQGTLTINSGSEWRQGVASTNFSTSGNIVNNGTFTSVAVVGLRSVNAAGLTAATTAQSITGTGDFRNAAVSPTADFTSLIINNTTSGVAVTFNIGTIVVSTTADFTAGIVDIGVNNDFTLLSGGTLSPAVATAGGWLLRDATATGFMKRTLPGTGAAGFRIGDATTYSPINLNFTVNSVSRQLGASVSDGSHPQMNSGATPVSYLSRYWRLFENAAGGNYTFTAAMTYNVAGDVNGTETAIQAAAWDGSVWTQYGIGSVASPTLTSGTITQTTMTAINNREITGRLNPSTTYVWTGGANTTSWTDAANWSPSGTPGPSDIIQIDTAPAFLLSITDARTVAGLILNGTGNFGVTSTGSLTVTGGVTYASTATATFACGSTFTMSSAAAQTIPALAYGNLVVSGGARTWSNAATTSICGNLTTGSVTFTTTGSTVNFNGTGAQSITGTVSFATVNVTGSGSVVSSANNTTVGTAMNVSANAVYNQTGGTLTFSSGSANVFNGTLRNSVGTFTTTGATLTFNSGGTYEHNVNGGVVPTSTWNSGSTCAITGVTATQPTGLGQTFHHFTWNSPVMNTTVNILGALTTINGDFSVLNTGTATNGLRLTNSAGSMTVNGNMIVSAATGVTTRLDFNGNTGAYTINLLGNLTISNTGGTLELTETGSGSGAVNFRKVGTALAYAQQNFTQNGGSILNNVNFTVGAAGPTYTVVQLQTPVAMSTTSTFSVTSGSAVDFQTHVLTGGIFTLNNGANLITANTAGIASSGATGSVQTTTRTFNASCNFYYNGTANQITGTGLPATANILGINNANNVSLTSPLTLNAPGALIINDGKLYLGTSNLTLASGVTINLTGASNYVVTDNTGALGLTIGTTPATYLYPIGDATGTVEYSPASINVASNASSRTMHIRVVDGVHPNNGTSPNYISRYWVTTQSSIVDAMSYVPTFTHLAGDVVGTLASMQVNVHNGTTWSEPTIDGVVSATSMTSTSSVAQNLGGVATLSWNGRTGRCDGTPNAGNAVLSIPGPFCNTGTTVVSLSGADDFIGISYQWQFSTTGAVGTYSDLSGATSATYSVNAITTSIWYQCVLTCSYSGLSSTSAAVQVVVNPLPNVTVTSPTTLVCGTNGVTLTASGAVSYAWSPATGLSATTGASVVATPTANTTYTVTGTDANSCQNTATISLTYAPDVPTYTVTTSVNPPCSNIGLDLGTTVGAVSATAYNEPFSATTSWTAANNSTLGTPANAAWTVRSSGYVYSSVTFTTSDASTFWMSNSDAQGSGSTTATTLTSPAINLSGFTSATITLNHYFRAVGTGDNGAVEVSTNGTTWTNVATYTANTGTATAFANSTINLNAYAGLPVVYLRLNYNATFDWYWAVNNLSITGNVAYTYDWSSTPSGFTSTLATPSAMPTVPTTYNVTVTNSLGCSRTGSATVASVVPPADVDAGVNASTCVNQAISLSGTQANATSVSWAHNGTGTLANATTLTPTYTPGALDAGNTVTFTLTGNSTSPCDQATDNVTVTVLALGVFYADADGDGFGNPFASVSACTAGPGQVANGDDCNDSNAAINPFTEWYADMDGDGYGSFVFLTSCTNPGIAGVVAQGGDCNDSNPNVYPGGPEVCQNGIDDDCDGQIDEGCSGIVNDNWSDATSVVNLTYYPGCSIINGTLLNAAISPQGNPANVAVGGGRDVWYKFTAPSTGVQIKVVPTGFNAVIELQNNSGTEIGVENANTNSGGVEILNTGGLTEGAVYRIGVRNFANSTGGSFTICISPLMDSRCDGGSGTYAMCSNFKADYTGANTYTFMFTPTGVTPGSASSGTAAGQIALNTPLDIRYGGTYTAYVNANYNLVNGVGTPEPITIPGTDVCNITIGAQPSAEVKDTQRCPASITRTTRLQAKPFICGPVVNFEFEFTQINCTTSAVVGVAFSKFTPTASANLLLNFSSPALVAGACYSVRVRPIFTYGAGSWGGAQCIQIAGTASTTLEMNYDEEGGAGVEAMLYPNPNNGSTLNMSIESTEMTNVHVRILDQMGRVIFQNQYGVDGTLTTEVNFETPLANGLYFVEFIADNRKEVRKMMVQK